MKPPQYAHIHLPAPNASKQDLYMPASEVKRARAYFQDLVKRSWTTVKRVKTGENGVALHFQNTIHVPLIKDKGSFYLCLHEMGHIRTTPVFIDQIEKFFSMEATVINEYNADQFALEHAQLFGLDTALFEKHAKRCAFEYVYTAHLEEEAIWADFDERFRNIATNWLGITETDWLAEELILID